MGNRFLREEDIVENPGQSLEVGNGHLDEIVGYAGERTGFLHFLQSVNQALEALNIAGVVGGQRNLDKHHNIQLERLGIQRGVITSDNAGIFKPAAPTLALRGGKADFFFHPICVSQATINLQSVKDFKVKTVEGLFPQETRFICNVHALFH